MADRKFVDSMLKAHNDYRRAHGVPALKINKDLNRMAQAWADQLARRDAFEHSKNRTYQSSPVGENLAMKWTSNNEDYLGDEATKQWYDEISKYNFRTASGPGTGHFTQVVWRDSRELGVGKAQTRDGKWLAVANYFPAGNYIGRYSENVPPPGSKPVKAAPPPKASAPSRTTVTTGQAAPRTSSGFMNWLKKGPKGWFGSKSSSSSSSKQVPIVQAREFNPSGGVIHVQSSSKPTFSTTVVTESNSRPGQAYQVQLPASSSNLRPGQTYQVQLPTSSTSQTRGFSKTVVTKTVVGPDGSRTVTTTETVNNSGGGPGFGQSRTKWS